MQFPVIGRQRERSRRSTTTVQWTVNALWSTDSEPELLYTELYNKLV